MSNELTGRRLLRSWLFVPGTRLDLLAKAVRAGTDAIIVDLEDAVLPEHKAPARLAVAQLPAVGCPLYVRVNAVGTKDFALDVPAAVQARVSGIVLPKVERPEDFDALLALMPAPLPVVALIETAKGLANLPRIATHPVLHCFAFGGVDFGVDVGCASDSTTMRLARSKLVLASRAANLPPPIDGVTVSLDAEVMEQDARDAKLQGFGGKLCIHPRQLEHANRAFRPTEDEIAWATRVAERADEAQVGALLVDGEMVDRPVLERAQRILAEVRQR
ncbi:HpcH/HpaI aldolase/citrate lyase family protein [Cupriavidus consociatus]|uniref:HpcH/HpaI aldolase/citrate lyase family protein n=1 Tax=Cupriavidus consociatus TaxID=2821357 RepID=UPI001AE8D52E|nr:MULTISPECIES: CoA ester lyase [unclassified Cupriavidus]MBP0621171.1 CoA ester lyase [Cupriavidus sp. LEh25]MDK2657841.1 CoA ester lyase [Cupriavidus sp. LEh21]